MVERAGTRERHRGCLVIDEALEAQEVAVTHIALQPMPKLLVADEYFSGNVTWIIQN